MKRTWVLAAVLAVLAGGCVAKRRCPCKENIDPRATRAASLETPPRGDV